MDHLAEPFPHNALFKKLCGKEYSACVALVLTNCKDIDSETCQKRTKDLTDQWKKLLDEKALVYSHDGTKKSAWDVVAGLGVI